MRSIRLTINLLALLTLVLLGATPGHAAPAPRDHLVIEDTHAGEMPVALEEGHASTHESAVHCGSPVLDVAPPAGHQLMFDPAGYPLLDAAGPPCLPIALDPRPPRA